MEILVGYTGFVGGNIIMQRKFNGLYNSKNIKDAFGTCPNLLVYSGVPAEMYLANKNPHADRTICETAVNNIRMINPKKLVLISTIAVLDNPGFADEKTVIDESKLTAYGYNRLVLEREVLESFPNLHIIRLPALFGKGLKKNFIFDMINCLPQMLTEAKYTELSASEPLIEESYLPSGNGFRSLSCDGGKRAKLKDVFERVNFSALAFTDSRSVFQFYNLAYLWEHIEVALKHGIPLLHMATEPVAANELYEYIYGKTFRNELQKEPFKYNFRTNHSQLFDMSDGYIFTKEKVFKDIKEFVLMEALA